MDREAWRTVIHGVTKSWTVVEKYDRLKEHEVIVVN